jgi:hypothetical protein
LTRGIIPLLLLAACGGSEPIACEGFADRELGITGAEYRPCAAAILATLDSLRPRVQALAAGDVAAGDEARPHYRALQAMIKETGIASDYRSTRSSTVLVKWPEASMRAFNSAAFTATVQYGAVLAFPNDDNFQQGVRAQEEARRAYGGIH